jgi:hypothetical protein
MTIAAVPPAADGAFDLRPALARAPISGGDALS